MTQQQTPPGKGGRKTGKTEVIVVRPQDFIRSPYVPCPFCGVQDAFGVLHVQGDSFTRRCNKCLRSQSFSLPPLKRKVIYLDQLALSELVKASSKQSRASKAGRILPFWRTLAKRLDRLLVLQLISCPESFFHDEESAVSSFRGPLDKMARRLSADVRFKPAEWIQMVQVFDQARAWLAGGNVRDLRLDVAAVVSGDLTAWQDVFYITVDMGDPKGYIEALRSSRGRLAAHIAQVFNRWRGERAAGKGFKAFFEEETRSWGPAQIDQYVAHLDYMLSIHQGQQVAFDPFPPASARLIRGLAHHFSIHGVPKASGTRRVAEYLRSDAIEWLPFNRIAGALWATLAYQSNERAGPPNQGQSNDISMISSLLPYCDAMFIDREAHGLLNNIPKTHRPDYPCQVFSARNRDEFLSYLKGIEASASKAHLDRVAEVYGERLKPSTD